jgi:hypothetical protein
MKKLFLFLLFIPFISSAQPYTKVVEIPNQNAEAMYYKAREWVAINFRSANDVIQLDDAKNLKIVAKGYLHAYYVLRKKSIPHYVRFTLMVDFKDNKYRYYINPEEIVISTIAGSSYDYQELKECSTPEGMRNYYKRMKRPIWLYGPFNVKKWAARNMAFMGEIDVRLQNMLDELTAELQKTSMTNQW